MIAFNSVQSDVFSLINADLISISANAKTPRTLSKRICLENTVESQGIPRDKKYGSHTQFS